MARLRWVGDPIPPFRLAVLGRDDERISPADWAGRRTLLVLWPGHLSEIDQEDLCLVCRRRATLRRRGIEVVGLVTANPWADRLPDRCAPFPLALDPDGRAVRAFGLPVKDRLRAAYLVGPDGTIEAAGIGDRVRDRLLDLESAC
jgi:peroxiredoxin